MKAKLTKILLTSMLFSTGVSSLLFSAQREGNRYHVCDHKSLKLLLKQSGTTADEDMPLMKSDDSSVNILDEYGDTPLGKAIFGGRVVMTRSLIERKADVNLQDSSGRTPLIVALLRYGFFPDLKILKLLVDHNADINYAGEYGLTPLGIAQQRGHSDVLALFRK